MSSDEEWVRRVAATLRSALERERTVPMHDGDAIKAAVGALIDDRHSESRGDMKGRRLPAS